MIDSKLIDSSVWIDYFFYNKFAHLIDTSEIHLISSLSLFEIERKLRKEKIDKDKITKSMEYIHLKSLVVALTGEIAQKAVEFSLQHHLGAMDALIYATAIISKAQLITCDNDFRGLANTMVVE